MHQRLATLVLAVALIAAACGDDAGPATGPATAPPSTAPSTSAAPSPSTDPSTSTTAAPVAIAAEDLAATGPYPVGVRTRELPTGNLVDIWYPAGPEAEGDTDTYAVRAFLPDAIATLVPPDIPDTFTVEASRDATPADDGPFPLVLFSHGFAGFRYQSTALTHHLASWGMVVASADHPTRNLFNVLGLDQDDHASSSDDLRAVRALLADDGGARVFGGTTLVDADRVALAGHSAGGGTVSEVAFDDGIAGYISYASGGGDGVLAPVPALFMAGALDGVAEPARTRAAFESAPAPAWYWEIPAAGHLAFSDLCAIGGGEANLIDLAEAAGIGALVPDNLRALGTDGCEPPNRPVEEVWPAIHMASTAFLRWVLGTDPEPLGLDGATPTATALGVEVATK